MLTARRRAPRWRGAPVLLAAVAGVGTPVSGANNVTIGAAVVDVRMTAGPDFRPTEDAALLTQFTLQSSLATADSSVATGAAPPSAEPGDLLIFTSIASAAGFDLTLSAHRNITGSAASPNLSSSSAAGSLSLTASAGQVTIGDLSTQSVRSGGASARAGSIVVTAGTSVAAGHLRADSVSGTASSGSGGAVTVSAGTGELRLASVSTRTDAATANAPGATPGSLYLSAGSLVVIAGGIDAGAYSTSGSVAGGLVRISAGGLATVGGPVAAHSVVAFGSGNAGAGGTVAITAAAITLGGTVSASSNVDPVFFPTTSGTAAAGGHVSLMSTTGPIAGTDLGVFSHAASGSAAAGGIITANGAGGVTFTGTLAADSRARVSGNAAAGGDIAVTSAGPIEIGTATAASLATNGRAGPGGAISLNSSGGAVNAQSLDTSTTSGLTGGPTAAAGDVAVTAGTTISVGAINASARVGNSAPSGPAGNVTLSAPLSVTLGAADVRATTNLAGGTVTITSDEIDLGTGAANAIRGTGPVLLQPHLPGRPVLVGAAVNTGSALTLTAGDLDGLAAGFASVTIGRTDSSGVVTVTGAPTFKAPTTLRSPAGSIILEGATLAVSTGQSPLLLSAPHITVNGGAATLRTNVSPITVNGAIHLHGDLTVTTPALTAIGAPISFNGPIGGPGSLTVRAGSSTATLSPLNTYTGNTTVASGTLLLTGSLTSSPGIALASGATLTLAPSAAKVLRTSSLTIPAAATVDLNDNAAIVDYAETSPIETIRTLIAAAAGPDLLWTSPGITSSTARALAAHVVPGPATGLGYSESSLYAQRTGQTTFAGQPLTGPAVLVRHTYVGDATLDGTLTDADVDAFIAGYGSRITTALWTHGDFTYDGVVNDRDLDLLVTALGHPDMSMTVTPAAAARLRSLRHITAVPEPSLTLIAAITCCLAIPRRRLFH